MSTCSPIADILLTLLRQLTTASRTGYNDAGQGISSHELQLRDLRSKRLLGEGLAGIGYETEWKGERYARKEFVGVPSAIFREEAANLVGLEDHKNIVKTYGWTVDKRSCSLVLDFMDDDLLGLLLKRKEAKRNLTNVGSGTRYEPSHFQPFELPEALNVITEIAEGMKQLHDKRIEHGDLKTRNILIKYMNDSGDLNSLTSVKVADFGLVLTKRKSIFLVSPQARKLDMVQWKAPEYLSVLISLKKLEDKDETSSDSDSSSEENTALIRSGVDIRRLRSYDVFAADVYSFALTCSQILTGEEPFPNSNWKELVEKILNSNLRPTLLDAWPVSLKELLQSCWDKDPSKRPTFSDIVQILQVIQGFVKDCEPTPRSSRIASDLLSTNVGNLDFKETPTKVLHKEDSEHTSMGTFSEDDKTRIEKRKDSKKSQEEAIQVPGTISSYDASTSDIIVMSGTSKSQPKRRTSQAMEEPNSENLNLRNSTDYDVFLNYGGVMKTNVLLLDEALRRVGCHPFIDVRSLQKGSAAISSIQKALHGALVHVAIFSRDYANSEYCLNELCDMIASGKPLIPVFYGVKPEDLRSTKQGPFAEAFIHHLESGRNEDVDRWKRALYTASSRNGFNCYDHTHYMELQKQVVAAVLGSLSTSFPRPALFAPRRVGLKNISMDVITMLHNMGENVGVMGICGMGGIGKTTLVREVYNQMQLDFENRCFLEDVKDAESVMDLQMKMVTDLLQVDVKKMNWDFENRCFLEDVKDAESVMDLQMKMVTDLLQVDVKKMNWDFAHWFEKIQEQKVFLVVDDISKREQFDELIVHVEKLAPGSRVLITSRDSNILNSILADVPQPQCALYPMPMLSFQDSLELLYQCVFHQEKNSDVEDIFRLFSQEIIMGNEIPLVLEVIGGFLADRKNEPECWREAISVLRESHGIISKLHIIYDQLRNDIDKCMFEDIACFMLGHSKHIVLEFWNSVGYDSPASGSLQRLIDKYLVKVDGKGQLRMHDLLRDMGREVVMNRAGHCDLLSHIWHPTMAAKILQKQHGLNEVLVALSVVGVDHHIASKAESYARMRALRYLSLDGYGVEGDFSGWSMELRWLQWRYMPFGELPSSLELPNLVVLDLASSPCLTRVWARIEVPCNVLRVLILRECTKLEKLPQHIDKILAKLKVLDLEGCSSLSSLPDSLGNLEELENLNLSSCSNLTILPNFSSLGSLQILKLNECKGLSKLPESFGNSMLNLEELWLNGCELLQRLPSSFCQLINLKYLNMKETALEELPDAFGQLQGLWKVDFGGCKWLVKLPESFGNLFNLEEVLLNECELLQKLPSSLCNLTKLRVLNLWRCSSLKQLPAEIGKLTGLTTLELSTCSSLKQLPAEIGKLTGLTTLELSRCSSLEQLPADIGKLTGLKALDFWGCSSLEQLPAEIGKLTGLTTLKLWECSSLKQLPAEIGKLTGLTTLELFGCSSLVLLPVEIGKLTGLTTLELSGCSSLDQLPAEIGKLTGLTTLKLWECSSLKQLPAEIGKLTGLKTLELFGCSSLVLLPVEIGKLTGLTTLELSGCSSLDQLPAEIGKLTGLTTLKLWECSSLKQLPAEIGKLTGLKTLELFGCSSLVLLPVEIGKLTGLTTLKLSRCSSLEQLPAEIGKLTGLKALDFWGCSSLEQLPAETGKLTGLTTLKLWERSRLKQLPAEIGKLIGLMTLYFTTRTIHWELRFKSYV